MKISNLYKEYSSSNFTLNISNAEILEQKKNVIIGENGCGKSLFLKHILSEYNNSILLLQSPYIFNKSVEQSLNLVKCISNSNTNINELITLLDLEKHRNSNALSLSGGLKQRVALAMILVCDKDIILLDEPFNGIDVVSQKIIVNLINTLKDKTFVIVTHKINHAKQFGDHFIYMKDGEIVWKGNKQTFFSYSEVEEFVSYE